MTQGKAQARRDEELRAAEAEEAALVTPGTTPTRLAVALDRAEVFVRRFVVLTDHQADAVVLWVALTHGVAAVWAAAYLWVTSPEKQSGKTRLLEVLALPVANPWITGGTTKAALVRKLHGDHPTLLLDESDAAFNGDKEYSEALRGVLNNGYTRGKPYTTCVGTNNTVQDFDVFGPKAIAGIGKLPDTVVDRSIPIRLKRRSRSEQVERFRERLARQEAEEIQDEIAAAVGELVEELDEATPELPEELSDRAQDIWEPLLALADAARGEWPTRARDAAKAQAGVDVEEQTLGIQLLADIREVFGEQEKMATEDVLAALNGLVESPWGGWSHGAGVSPRDLANKLRPYAIRSRSVRIGDKTPKGYQRSQFEDAWSRYLPEDGTAGEAQAVLGGAPAATPATTAPASQKPALFQAQHDPDVADGKGASNPHFNADVADVADKAPPNAAKQVSGGVHSMSEEEYARAWQERQAKDKDNPEVTT